MKYKLLSVSKIADEKDKTINIGDYIQALAASQFYPVVDGFVDRDEDLKDYDGEPCVIIMNGWYMHSPENWPPSDKIEPLFVAFHINSVAKDMMLRAESLEYLKRHEPIGCRDTNTMDLLKQHGIDSYFSGCLTLTLGYKYHSNAKSNEFYIVDPLMNANMNGKNTFKALIELIAHPLDVYKLNTEKGLNLHPGRNFLKKVIRTSLYYREYKKIFGREMLMNAIYISHDNGDFYKNNFTSDNERLREAERLIKMYAKAKFVLTSRIHCALPCLGIGTPVVYLENFHDIEESKCRMGGLRELFNIIRVDNGVLKPLFESSIPISPYNPPSNKKKWKPLAEDLIKKCSELTPPRPSESPYLNDKNDACLLLLFIFNICSDERRAA